MKHLIFLFVALTAIFFGIWNYKLGNPVARPDEYQEGFDADAGAWWKTQEVEEEWRLDPTIPLNYIPVPGEDELYMVVDTNGNITEYVKRTRQVDGSWAWEKVNPDIPDGYEPVIGLDNVYKVTDENGNVSYKKYIRNSDDTFAFVDVDEHGNLINVSRDATKIDGRHIHISGNLYELLDENGVVIGYDKRIELDDGSLEWFSSDLNGNTLDASLPDYSSDLSDFLNSNGGAGSSFGNMSVPALDTSGMDEMAAAMDALNAAGGGSSSSTTTFTITPEDLDKYFDGVDDGTGGEGIYGKEDIQQLQEQLNNGGGYDDYAGAGNATSNSMQDAIINQINNQGNNNATLTPAEPIIVNNPDGTHTEEEIVTETRTIDGVTKTYETHIYNVYDEDGNLINTSGGDEYEVDSTTNIVKESEPIQTAGGNKADTLTGEYARVAGSYTYEENLPTKVFSLLNAQRAENNLPALTMTETAMQIARLRAADMAAYDTSKGELPTYGTLGKMIHDYGISSVAPGENLWKSIPRDSDDIHLRFQAVEGSRNTRMNKDVTQYGFSVCIKNNVYYICEVLL